MQGGGAGRDPFAEFGHLFSGFGRFGGLMDHGNWWNPFSVRKHTFEECFEPPIGGMFESRVFGPIGSPFAGMLPLHPSGFIGHEVPEPKKSRGPIIEELNSDDENEKLKGPVIIEVDSDDGKEIADREKKENPRKHGRSDKELYVLDQDNEAEETKSKHLLLRNDYNRFNNMEPQPPAHSFTFQSSTVTYGGANGAYYTSSKTRRMGSDGVIMEESKEADTATRKATHSISRGLQNKGHTLTRKLKSDGKVETMQTLHNLHEDELTGFEEAWNGSARRHLPGWTGSFSGHDNMGSGSSVQNAQASQGGWALPSTEPSQHSERMASDIRKSGRMRSSCTQRSGRIKVSSGIRDKPGSSGRRARE